MNGRINTPVFWTVGICWLAAPAAQGLMLFVDAGCGDDVKVGTSSNCADADGPKRTIQAAINAANVTDEIVVAPGVYGEVIDFQGKAVTLRSSGGANVTTIDGGGAGSVVTCASGEGPDTILKGFAITGGTGTDLGGGLAAGGGMFIQAANPTVIDCAFIGNAVQFFGCGIYNTSSSPSIFNCVFSGNTAQFFGGGMYNFDGSNPVVTNCTFSSNTATSGSGMYNNAASPTLTNCILWGDGLDEIFNFDPPSTPTISFSNVQGGLPDGAIDGGDNIDADPLFADPDGDDDTIGTEDDNLRLTLGSSSADAGDDAAVPTGLTTDLDGNPRFFDGDGDAVPTVDMGAYELQETLPNPDPLELWPNPFGGNEGAEKLNRVGAFQMPASSAGQEMAIRVTLNKLYEEWRGCSHDPSVDCGESADCQPGGACEPDDCGPSDATCPFLNSEGCPNRVPPLSDLSEFEGQVRWLGPPEVFDNNALSDPKWVGAKLQCAQFYRDWSTSTLAVDLGISEVEAETIYYYGAEVVPCSTHAVQQATQRCVDSASEGCFSDPLTVGTAFWGDVSGDGHVSFTDMGLAVNAFKSIPLSFGQDGHWRSMLRENEGAPGSKINFTDIGKTVEAFKSIAYSEIGPVDCP